MEKVIFDTNAYRYLVTNVKFDEIEKLHAKEKLRGIESIMSPIVAFELLAHVADRKDKNFEKCLKAIKAMYLHNSHNDEYRILASPEMLVAKSFFDQELPKKQETIKASVQIASHLSKKPTPYVFKKFQHTLNQINSFVQEVEENFALQLQGFVKTKDPKSTSWRLFPDDKIQRQKVLTEIRSEETSKAIAGGLLYAVYDYILNNNIMERISEDVFNDMCEKFVSIFPEYIALYKLVFENLVNSEFNLLEDSRSNFLWDIQLMLNIGDHSIHEDKLFFVTSDKAIISTAVKNNAKYSILTFEEYLEYIN